MERGRFLFISKIHFHFFFLSRALKFFLLQSPSPPPSTRRSFPAARHSSMASSQLELDVIAAIELLDALARASTLDAEIRRAAASAGGEPSSPQRRPSSAGSSAGTPAAAAPIDAPAVTPGQSSAPSLNRDDLDAAAAVAFVFETAAGAGVVAGAGRALVLAKVEGQRGWWSAPLVARVFSVGAGASLGARRCATLAFLGRRELERLARGSRVRLSAGASLCLAVPLAAKKKTSTAATATAAGTTSSKSSSSSSSSRKGFSPSLYRSTDLGFDFAGGSLGPDHRVSRGLMADFSLRVSALFPCDKLTREALGDGQNSSSSSKTKVDRGELLSGRTPAPLAIRPLARRLNAAAGLAARPAAPWPGVSK